MGNFYLKPMSVAMGINLGLVVILLGLGMFWRPVLPWGVAFLLALPAVGIISAMVGMASAKEWRYFFLGVLLLILMGLAVIAGFVRSG